MQNIKHTNSEIMNYVRFIEKDISQAKTKSKLKLIKRRLIKYVKSVNKNKEINRDSKMLLNKEFYRLITDIEMNIKKIK